MNRVAFLSGVSIVALGLTTPADAWLPRGVSSAPSAPILQAVSVPFGVKTPTGRGGVRLSALDITTTSVKPQTFSGLGLMSPTAPACATWTIAFVSNTSGRTATDFTLIAADTADASAVTPVPSSGGNQNLAGTYVWNVFCKDSGGNQSNTVTLTYTPDANTATVGTADATNNGLTPGSFGSVAGAKLTMAVGLEKHGGVSLALPTFANTVTVTPADTARRPYLTQLGIGGASPGKILVSDFVLSGAITGVPSNAIIGIAPTAGNVVSDIVFDGIHFYGSETLLGSNSAQGAISFFPSQGSCSSNCGVQNSSFDYVESGYSPASHSFSRNVAFRYVYNNCIFFTNPSDVELSDVKCLSPMQRPGGAHPDMMQICDGCTPGLPSSPVVINRFLASQADGDYFAQGPYFAGTLLHIQGYVGPSSNVFTKTSGNFPSISGETVTIPGSVLSSAGITMTVTSGTTATLNGLSPTTIGSVGSPVDLYGVATQSFQMSGIMSSQGGPYGTATPGNNGTSWLYDYDYVILTAQNPLVGTFDGEIVTPGTLTAYSTAASSVPNETAFITSGGRLNIPTCAYCFNGGVAGRLTGTDFGPGTYTLQNSLLGTVARQTMQISGVYGGQAAPYWVQSNCQLPDVQGGTYNIDRGFFQSGMFPNSGGGCTVGVNFPAANTTIGSHAFGPTANSYTPPGGALTSADYASGVLPEAYLAAHPFTASDTPDDILRINCLANKGKIGGKKDGGSGVWYGAVTGETNAGTHTGGGDWIIFNGTSHVASTHITGCELAP